MAGDNDDIVVIPPPPRRPPRPLLIVAGCAVLAASLAGGIVWSHHAPPAAIQVRPLLPLATEAEIDAEVAAARTTLRFAGNPAIVVLDFPTLAEQARMLNRVAAWAEKAGAPHDRLMNDAQLDAAISATGDTPETYYLGHDYRAADIMRFFALADEGHLPLNPAEEELRGIALRAAAEPNGFGALITIPQASPENKVDRKDRHAILHHELSHGEYFSNAAYARFVGTMWQTVLTADERARFRSFLASEDYDPSLEDVMINEMQAYLMHTPDKRFFDPKLLGIPAERLQRIREAFLAGMPASWLKASIGKTLALPDAP